uniref:Myotubularin phosphatase domain-containing protein n=1 Tax=Romanomermis culicivorax TaxID=13658 RepID=A0A915I8Y1_ROMCU
MLILDARSYTAAWANRAKGGGFENKENYQNCEIEFLGLANIHAVRSSFQKLRSLLWDSNGVIAGRSNNAHNAQSSFNDDLYYESGYFQNLDACQWPQHLFILLNASAKVVHAIHKQGRCVLVHCSDGWDRTTQIVSLAKLMLDPYYRTMQGFKELLEREWIAFGHKFAERCGLLANGDPNQKAPVFLQWLDCVRYLLREFPCSFQFNEIFLWFIGGAEIFLADCRKMRNDRPSFAPVQTGRIQKKQCSTVHLFNKDIR